MEEKYGFSIDVGGNTSRNFSGDITQLVIYANGSVEDIVEVEIAETLGTIGLTADGKMVYVPEGG